MIKFDPAKALEHTTILLAGDEAGLRRKALDEVLALAAGGDDFDVEMFTADSSNPTQWLASAGTAPFLSPRRVAVVRNLLRCDDPSPIGEVQLPPTGLLVLVADEEAKSEDRDRKSEGSARKWETAVKKAGGASYIFKVDPKDLIVMLRDQAKSGGKQLSPAAAERLSEMCGGSLSRAMDELEKLILFAGQAGAISERDVEDVVVSSREWNVFKLIDAVVKSDAAGALRQLRIMIGSNNKAEGVAFSTIFPMLGRQLKLIWQARAVLDAGGSPDNIPSTVASYFPTRPNLSAEKDYPRKLAFQFARAVTLRQIHNALEALADADARMKGLEPGFSTSDTLERLVLDLVDALRKRAAA